MTVRHLTPLRRRILAALAEPGGMELAVLGARFAPAGMPSDAHRTRWAAGALRPLTAAGWADGYRPAGMAPRYRVTEAGRAALAEHQAPTRSADPVAAYWQAVRAQDAQNRQDMAWLRKAMADDAGG